MSTNEYLLKSFAKDDSVVSRKIADELLLVPIRKIASQAGAIYTTTDVGIRIWELIDGHCTVKQILNQIVQEFDVALAEAQQDAIEFLQQLHNVGAIQEAPSASED